MEGKERMKNSEEKEEERERGKNDFWDLVPRSVLKEETIRLFILHLSSMHLTLKKIIIIHFFHDNIYFTTKISILKATFSFPDHIVWVTTTKTFLELFRSGN